MARTPPIAGRAKMTLGQKLERDSERRSRPQLVVRARPRPVRNPLPNAPPRGSRDDENPSSIIHACHMTAVVRRLSTGGAVP